MQYQGVLNAATPGVSQIHIEELARNITIWATQLNEDQSRLRDVIDHRHVIHPSSDTSPAVVVTLAHPKSLVIQHVEWEAETETSITAVIDRTGRATVDVDSDSIPCYSTRQVIGKCSGRVCWCRNRDTGENERVFVVDRQVEPAGHAQRTQGALTSPNTARGASGRTRYLGILTVSAQNRATIQVAGTNGHVTVDSADLEDDQHHLRTLIQRGTAGDSSTRPIVLFELPSPDSTAPDHVRWAALSSTPVTATITSSDLAKLDPTGAELLPASQHLSDVFNHGHVLFRDMVKSCVWSSGGFLGRRDILGGPDAVLEGDSSDDIG